MLTSRCLRNGLTGIVLTVAFGQAGAAELTVRVLDSKGKPVPEVVVTAIGQTSRPEVAARSRQAKPAVMDQIDRQFVPRILVVETGASVTFPNSDSVSHQVYSFSPAKRFQLSLYRSHALPPQVLFDQPGVVVLGCNIHDAMIGYIYVAASPYFGKTDANGRLVFNALPAQSYEVTLWNPRFKDPQMQISRQTTVNNYTAGSLEVRLTQDLKPEPRRLPNDNY